MAITNQPLYPEDIRSMREALQSASSQATPAYQRQLEQYYKAVGAPLPQPVSTGTELTWEQDPSTGSLDQRQSPVPVYGTEARDILSTGGLPVTQDTGVVSSAQPSLEEQQARVYQAQTQRREAAQKMIRGQFEEQVGELREAGEKRFGGAEAQLALQTGAGFSSSRDAYLRGIEKDTQKLISDLRSKESDALNKLDFDIAKETGDRLEQLQKMNFDTRTMRLNERMAALKAQPKQIEPFFQSADITNLMKSLPIGETRTIKDPLTDQEFTITGMGKRPEEMRPNIKSYSFTNKRTGEVTFVGVDENTGQIVSKESGGRIGEVFAPIGTISAGISNNLNEAVSDLKKTVGDDGYVNTAAYKEYRDRFITTHPGKAKDFDNQMRQLGINLNPNDPTAAPLLGLISETLKLGGGSGAPDFSDL